jgi:hypothetical protein
VLGKTEAQLLSAQSAQYMRSKSSRPFNIARIRCTKVTNIAYYARHGLCVRK